MAKPRPIQYRAVHAVNRWRRSDHETEKHALEGSSSTDTRSARALFEHRNSSIDYKREGEPRYVLVWDPNASVGTIVRPDSSEPDGLKRAVIPVAHIERLEHEGGPSSDAQLERYFVPGAVSSQVPEFHGLEDVLADFNRRLEDSLRSNARERKMRLSRADPLPPRVEVLTSVFVRNTDVIVEVLERAAGACEGCRAPAPFVRASDGTPYLEVHHRVPLASGGPDAVANAVALCPNCHRQRHFGKVAV
jgi:hypothetical protein